VLQNERLIRWEALLAADHTSPYYNEQNKATSFYAQSWALVHYCMVGEQRDKKYLSKYLEKIEAGVPQLEAAQQTFGDLKKLEQIMERYAKQFQFGQFEMKALEDLNENSYAAKVVSPADSAALRGEFHAQMQRPKEAHALLEEAQRLDPNSATAQEGLAQLALQGGDKEKALEHFNKAVELGSTNFLVHYYVATLEAPDFGDADWMQEKEKRLRKVIE
jgi:tetratricopeptide (TPR) repeat protein